MKAVKIIVAIALVYVGIVVAFESMIGILQPEQETTLVITTLDASGTPNERVVSRLESGGQVYVAANHWPRAWYEQALANPAVQVTFAGTTTDYVAVPVSGEEAARVHAENNPGMGFRILTGFPPRLFLRLDPKPQGTS